MYQVIYKSKEANCEVSHKVVYKNTIWDRVGRWSPKGNPIFPRFYNKRKRLLFVRYYHITTICNMRRINYVSKRKKNSDYIETSRRNYSYSVKFDRNQINNLAVIGNPIKCIHPHIFGINTDGTINICNLTHSPKTKGIDNIYVGQDMDDRAVYLVLDSVQKVVITVEFVRTLIAYTNNFKSYKSDDVISKTSTKMKEILGGDHPDHFEDIAALKSLF